MSISALLLPLLPGEETQDRDTCDCDQDQSCPTDVTPAHDTYPQNYCSQMENTAIPQRTKRVGVAKPLDGSRVLSLQSLSPTASAAWSALVLAMSWELEGDSLKVSSACGRGGNGSEAVSASAASVFARVPASQDRGHVDRSAGRLRTRILRAPWPSEARPVGARPPRGRPYFARRSRAPLSRISPLHKGIDKKSIRKRGPNPRSEPLFFRALCPFTFDALYFTHLSLGEIITCSLGNFSSASL
jgi:hypothetical protein